jgi:Protein of unknown function (DUF2934)
MTTPKEHTPQEYEQQIRKRAHAMWEEEGYPEGKAEVHWFLASEEVWSKLNDTHDAETVEPVVLPSFLQKLQPVMENTVQTVEETVEDSLTTVINNMRRREVIKAA